MTGRRRLARWLALLMIPVLVVAGPARQAAAADVARGQTATAGRLAADAGIPGAWYECTLTGYSRLNDAGIYTIRAVVNCRWGFANHVERLRMVAYGPGENCRFKTDISIEGGKDNEVTLVASMGATTPIRPDCTVTSVLVQPYANASFFRGNCGASPWSPNQADAPPEFVTEDGYCYQIIAQAGWAIGKMPSTPASENYGDSCAFGFVPGRPIYYGVKAISVNGEALQQFRGRFRFTWSAQQAPLRNDVQLQVALIYRNRSDGSISNYWSNTSAPAADASGQSNETITQATDTTNGVVNRRNNFKGSTGRSYVHRPPYGNNTTSVNEELWWRTPGDGSSYTGSTPERQFLGFQLFIEQDFTGGAEFPPASQKASPTGYGGRSPQLMGVTNPGLCAWYFGEKVFDNGSAANTIDEPAGNYGTSDGPSTIPGGDPPVNNPAPAPSGEDSQCSGFSFTDPSSWAGAGICVLVKAINAVIGVLRAILNAFKGLATAIADAITGALRGLFVPRAGFFEGQVDDVKDAWADTPPGEVVGTYAGLPDKFVPPGGSSCQGPALDLDLPMTSTDTVWRPFSACAGWSSTLARIARTSLQVGAYLGAFMLALRVLASSLGLAIPMGGGKDD